MLMVSIFVCWGAVGWWGGEGRGKLTEQLLLCVAGGIFMGGYVETEHPFENI